MANEEQRMRSRQDERRRSWRKHRAPQIHRGSAHRAWILGGRKKQGEKRQRQPHACGSVSRASLHDEELRRRVRVSRVVCSRRGRWTETAMPVGRGEKRQRQPHACGSVSRASLHDEELRRRVRVSRVAGAYQVRLRSGRRMKDVLLDFSRR